MHIEHNVKHRPCKEFRTKGNVVGISSKWVAWNEKKFDLVYDVLLARKMANIELTKCQQISANESFVVRIFIMTCRSINEVFLRDKGTLA